MPRRKMCGDTASYSMPRKIGSHNEAGLYSTALSQPNFHNYSSASSINNFTALTLLTVVISYSTKNSVSQKKHVKKVGTL